MRKLSSALLFATLFTASCQSTKSSSCCEACMEAQAVVASVAKDHSDCTRLTVHCAMAGGAAKCCASTDAARVGTASDPEDLKAMQTGQVVVLDEAGAIDVTVPINQKDGSYMSACGVTLKSDGANRDQAIARAKTIAMAVETGLGGACQCCCK